VATTTAKKPHKAQREDIESFLNDKAVVFEFKADLPIDQFDLDRSLKNQARINQVLNEPQVETYVEAMKRGDIFPGVLCYKDQGKYIAIDGNHRLQAAKIAGKKTVPAYIIDPKTDPKTIVLMTYEANAKHGLPNSVDERIRHAIYMVKNGTTQETAAARLNVTKAQLSRAYAKVRADDRAETVGLLRSKWEALPTQVRTRLGAIQSDETFSKATDFVIRARIQASGAGAYSKRSRNQSPKQALYIAFGFIEGAFLKEVQLLDSVAVQEEDDLLRRIAAAKEQLDVMVELVKKRKTER
jgi:ParB-like chromosome segregation protein Spo0J